MRPETVALLLKTLPASLFIFSIIILSQNLSISFYANFHTKKDPDFPDRQAYICSPQETNGKSDVSRFDVSIELFFSSSLVAACMQLIIERSSTDQVRRSSKIHWLISILSVPCFLSALKEIFQVSTGRDTQFYIILSVIDGSCKIAKKYQTDFIFLVAIFIARCIKGYFAICMGCVAYVFSILNVLYGSDATETVELELAETPVDTRNTGGHI